MRQEFRVAEKNVEGHIGEDPNKIETVFEDPREFLLNEKRPKEKKEKRAECPEIIMQIEGVSVKALIDSGSKLTCVSGELYTRNYEKWRTCTTLPLTGMQAMGFTGEKSVLLKKQFRATVIVGGIETELNFIIVPKLVRECIIGIDAQKSLNSILNVGRGLIQFSNETKSITIRFEKKKLAKTDWENISQMEAQLINDIDWEAANAKYGNSIL